MTLLNKRLSVSAALTTLLILSGCEKKPEDDTAPVDSVASEAAVDANVTYANTAADNAANTDIVTESTDEDKAVTDQPPSAVPDDATVVTTTLKDDQLVAPTPASDSQPSLMTNPVEPNTPEATLKQALDTLYYGDAKEAARYYQVDMDNFSEELAKTQFAFQQTVEAVTITNTTYNEDNTHASIDGELKLKGQKEPTPLTYEMQKIDGHWKILG